MRVAAVVVAAGSGERLGGPPKQFRPLGDLPLLAWSCRLFASHPEVDRLVVVLPADLAAAPPSWLAAIGASIVAGGPTRRASVGCGLEVAGDSGLVLIHDAARPFASADLVHRLLASARTHGAVGPVLELVDAVKQLTVAGGHISRTLDRSNLRAAQTPQVFALDEIRRLHQAADRVGEDAPDDAALCEEAGIEVRTIPGERWAFKITHPEDLALAEWLVATGRVRPADGH